MRPQNTLEHPGLYLRQIQPHLLKKAALAKELGVSRPTLNSLLRGKSRIRPETALRLGRLHNGPAFWLTLQLAWDLEQAQKEAHDIYQAQSAANG